MMITLRASIILAILALGASAQAQVTGDAAPAPAFKRAVTITRDVVRIGDLVDNAGAAADVAIFRSPDLGTTGTVSTATVRDAIKSHNLVIADTGGLGEIEVTRAARVIAVKDIEYNIARAFAGQYGLGPTAKLAVICDNTLRTLYLDPSSASDLQVARAQYDMRTKRFDVTFMVSAGGTERPSALRYTGSLFEGADALVLTRNLGRGDIIKSSDLTIERRPKAEVVSEIIDNFDDAVGYAVRQPLRAGQPLRRSDIAKAEMVKRDETVTIVFEAPGMLLTVRGKAIESGAEGDLISVQNVQSKRNVQGIVSGPGRVTVTSSTPTISLNTAAVTAPAQQPPSAE